RCLRCLDPVARSHVAGKNSSWRPFRMTRHAISMSVSGALSALALLMPLSANAGALSGKVVDPTGKAIEGAIVTATDGRGVGVSVYTDRQGAFRLDTSLKG